MTILVQLLKRRFLLIAFFGLQLILCGCSLNADIKDLLLTNKDQVSTPTPMSFTVSLSSSQVTTSSADQVVNNFVTVSLNQIRSVDTIFTLSSNSPDGANSLDYSLNLSSITISAGQLSQTVALTVKGKTASQDFDKRVNIQLSTTDTDFSDQIKTAQFTIVDSNPLVLTVNPMYPINGATWNSYVNPPSDIYPFYTSRYLKRSVTLYPSDSACTGGCVHGGEIRKVIVSNKSSCQNLTLTDSENAFEWVCASHQAPVYFYSLGFKKGKGLRDLIKTDGTDWKNLTVTINESATLVGTSSPAKWWSNTVESISAAQMNSGAGEARKFLSTSGRVYVLTQSAQTRGLEITADGVSFVTLSGVTLSSTATLAGGSGCTAPVSTCMMMTNKNRVWVEVNAINNIASSALFKNEGNMNLQFRFHNSNLQGVSTGYGIMIKATFGAAISETDFSIFNTAIYLGNLNAYSQFYDLSFKKVSYGIYNSAGPSFNTHYKHKYVDTTVAIESASGQISSYSDMIVSNSSTAFSSTTYSSVYLTNSLLVGNTNAVVDTGLSNIHSVSAINNSGTGIQANAARVVNTVLINNNKGYVSNNQSGSYYSATYSLTAADNITSEIEFANSSKDHNFFDALNLGSIANKCVFGTGLTNIGLSTSACLEAGSSSITRTINLNTSSLYEGFKNDTINTNGTNGLGGIAYTSISDYFYFENLSRVWTRFHSTFTWPSTNLNGICTATNCGIFDYSLKANASLLAKSNGSFVAGQACPATVKGSNYFYYIGQSADNYKALKYAIEYPLDGVGNDNGMCEANEKCYFLEDAGFNQAETWKYTNTCQYDSDSDPDLVNIVIYGP